MNVKGTLIPIGGNEDKGTIDRMKMHTLDFHRGWYPLSHVVKESGGEKCKNCRLYLQHLSIPS